MIKNWNRKTNINVDGRVYGIKFYDAQDYAKHLGMWRVLSGSIHMNTVETPGERSSEKMVGRFEARLYGDEMLTVELKGLSHRFDSITTSFTLPLNKFGEIDINWIREKVAGFWHGEYKRIKQGELT